MIPVTKHGHEAGTTVSLDAVWTGRDCEDTLEACSDLDGRRLREDLGFKPEYPRLQGAIAAGARVGPSRESPDGIHCPKRDTSMGRMMLSRCSSVFCSNGLHTRPNRWPATKNDSHVET